MLTKDEYASLKAWVKLHPELAFHRGDVGKGGLSFMAYAPRCSAGEWWVAETSLEKFRHHGRQKRPSEWLAEKARRRASPQRMERYREYHRQYRKRMTPRQKLMVEGYWKKYRSYGRWVKTDGKKHPGIKALQAQAMALSKKHGPLFELDHIIPLSSQGKHEPLNLQIIPRAVNREKSGDAFWLSDEYLDFRDVPEFLWPEHLKPHYQLMLRVFGHPLKKYAEAI